MDIEIINVRSIKKEELDERKVQFIKSQLFNKLNVYLTDQFDKGLNNLSSKGIIYETNLDNALFRIEFFEDPESLVSVLVATVEDNSNKETKLFVRLNIINNDNGNTVISDYLYDVNKDKFNLQEEKQSKEPAYDVWKSIINSSSKDIAEMVSISEIKASAFGDFCLPGKPKYEHCGKQCGTNGKYGGGPLKNKIDGCCYIHDRCYDKHKTKRCANCDIALINCVMNPVNYREAPATATAIAGWFTKKCVG